MEPSSQDTPLELGASFDSVVGVWTIIPDDAFTAPLLGTHREGSGVLIRRDGLILTIGYLILEAGSVWVVSAAGAAARAHIVGYDHDTGFGLIQAFDGLPDTVAALGDSDGCNVGDDVVLVGCEGVASATEARIISKREFAGAWEYVLDEALVTAPAHPDWSGAAVFDRGGRLLGIGSLYIQEVLEAPSRVDGNLSVPINLLKPIIDDIHGYGRIGVPARPWLGIYLAEAGDQVVVAGLAERGPAAHAGLRAGDVVIDLGGVRAENVGQTFRQLWSLGAAGIDVPMTIGRGEERRHYVVKSADRADSLKKLLLH